MFDVVVVEKELEVVSVGIAILATRLEFTGTRGCCGRMRLDTKNRRSCECRKCIHYRKVKERKVGIAGNRPSL